MRYTKHITLEFIGFLFVLALLFCASISAAHAAGTSSTATTSASTVFTFVSPLNETAKKVQEKARPFEISGWIPYWAATAGTRDARKHMEDLDIVYPFAFSVKSNGTLKDDAKLDKSSWQHLIDDAQDSDVLVIPTVMVSDGKLIHSLLSDPDKRAKHIKEIVDMVEDGDFDGVDIDYEAKLVKTKDSFSLFLKELRAALPKKALLTCAIESRTPADSLYRTVPDDIQYSNDLVAIGTYCDRVSIMGYDQRNADIKLNDAKKGAPYIPVADLDWVRKVVPLMSQSIPANKLVLGVPTYGHEYQVTVYPNGYMEYKRIRALNPDTALALAKKYDATPTRNSAGEVGFSYKTSTKSGLAAKSSVPKDTDEGLIIAARAAAYAKQSGKAATFNYVTWSDADAITEKLTYARDMHLAGVAIFKIDGQEDAAIWDSIEK